MIRLYCERIKFRSSKKPHAYFPFTGKNSSPPKPMSTVAQLQTGKGNSDRSTIVAIRTQNEVMTQKPTIFSHWLKPHKTHGKFPWKRNLPFSGFSLIFSGSINRFGGEPQSFTGRSNLDRSVGQTLPRPSDRSTRVKLPTPDRSEWHLAFESNVCCHFTVNDVGGTRRFTVKTTSIFGTTSGVHFMKIHETRSESYVFCDWSFKSEWKGT